MKIATFGRLCIWVGVLLGTSMAFAQDPNIVGGEPVQDGKYPFMVGVLEGQSSDAFNAFSCGASLIHPRWVLTAGHCVEHMLGKDLQIIIGTVDLSRPSVHTKRIKVKKIHLHPDFGYINYEIAPGILSRVPTRDIALLELEESIIAPVIQLPKVDDDAYNIHGLYCRIAGWGRSDPKASEAKSVFLKEAEIQVIDRDLCREYKFYDKLVGDDVLCAGLVEPGRPIGGASGDSGGPLFLSQDNGFLQIGVMSWATGFTDYEKPGVYQKISPFVQWIEDLVDFTSAVAEQKGLQVQVRSFPDRYEVEVGTELSHGRWAHFSLAGELLGCGPFRNGLLALERKSETPSVIYVYSDNGTWSRIVR